MSNKIYLRIISFVFVPKLKSLSLMYRSQFIILILSSKAEEIGIDSRYT